MEELLTIAFLVVMGIVSLLGKYAEQKKQKEREKQATTRPEDLPERTRRMLYGDQGPPVAKRREDIPQAPPRTPAPQHEVPQTMREMRAPTRKTAQGSTLTRTLQSEVRKRAQQELERRRHEEQQRQAHRAERSQAAAAPEQGAFAPQMVQLNSVQELADEAASHAGRYGAQRGVGAVVVLMRRSRHARPMHGLPPDLFEHADRAMNAHGAIAEFTAHPETPIFWHNMTTGSLGAAADKRAMEKRLAKQGAPWRFYFADMRSELVDYHVGVLAPAPEAARAARRRRVARKRGRAAAPAAPMRGEPLGVPAWFRDIDAVRQGIIMQEILGTPKGLQDL